MNFKAADYIKAVTRGHLPGTAGFERIVRDAASKRQSDERGRRVQALTLGSHFQLKSEDFLGGRPLPITDAAMAEICRYIPGRAIRVQRWTRGSMERVVVTPAGGLPAVVLEVRGTGYGKLL